MREVEMTVSAASITSDASGQPTRRSDISTSPLGMFLHGHRNFEQRDAGSNIPEIKPVRVDGDPVRERSGQLNVINGGKQGGAALSRAFHFRLAVRNRKTR
jgi:hypothetical protein